MSNSCNIKWQMEDSDFLQLASLGPTFQQSNSSHKAAVPVNM